MSLPKGAKYCPRCGGTGTVPDPAYHGEQARQRRIKAGVTLRQIAKRMGLSVGYLSDLELGRRGWSEGLTQRYIKALRGTGEQSL